MTINHFKYKKNAISPFQKQKNIKKTQPSYPMKVEFIYFLFVWIFKALFY